MEYPGYGVYDGEPNADQIALDAQNMYDYLTIVQGIPHSSILLFGRSIGSGPASASVSSKRRRSQSADKELELGTEG